MIDFKKLSVARLWIDKLANGVNPLNDEMLNDSDVVNNVHISRCLFYVAEMLDQLEEQEKKLNGTPKTKSFFLSVNDTKALPIEKPDGINNFVKLVNVYIPEDMKTLASVQVIRWLKNEGYLEEIEKEDGHRTNLPTPKGNDVGISTVTQQNSDGSTYTRVMYSVEAQRFILDNIEVIAPRKEA